MKCFCHNDRDAVGVCKACGRGLCRDCAADLGRALACKGRCEADARTAVELMDAALAARRRASRTPVGYVALAALLFVLAVLDVLRDRKVSALIALAGIVLAVGFIIEFARRER
jgi:hypothetical protein